MLLLSWPATPLQPTAGHSPHAERPERWMLDRFDAWWQTVAGPVPVLGCSSTAPGRDVVSRVSESCRLFK